MHSSEMHGMDSFKTRPIMLSEWAVVNNEWERTWKDKVFAHTSVLHRQFHEQTKETKEHSEDIQCSDRDSSGEFRSPYVLIQLARFELC
jgi:hypothetical protein